MRHKNTKVFIDGEVLMAPHFSGIGHYTLELLKAVDLQIKNDKSLDVSLIVSWRNIKKAQDLGFNNIKLVRSPFSQKISNKLKTFNIQPPLDLFFGRGIYIFPNFSSCPLISSKSIPFIYDTSYNKYPEYTEPKNRKFLNTQVTKSIKRASVIATISKSSRNDINELYKPNKPIEIFYPAINQSVFYKRSQNEIKSIKDKYGITGDYILFVGNIEPRKNLKNLLLAYEKLANDIKSKYPLLIVGAKGWLDDEINSIIIRLKSQGDFIQQPNSYIKDEDLPAIYSGAKIFIYPSLYEGFGIPPLEAMACGTPVITSDNSSIPEAVGDAAITVNARSAFEITNNITKLIIDKKLQRELIAKGYEQINNFSWNKSAIDFILELKLL
ncbi:glycosyltransferase family 1 protein [Candidatus Saccharibacteria bacterium HGW-Saccharibacteria-1]|jgi:glycosyltransferase involved in cell wall biosynthesis|nr:MAG: glycosyltransferase family 1 protein [Candidatus Saccharibacteria bacterium HGW-Saccharibacteria-1]